MINHKEIIDKLRLFMRNEGLNFFIVSSTDQYLNEYITLAENSRYFVTGFSGSTGDALVTENNVFLFVDGRYHQQADNETDKELITVVKLGLSDQPKVSMANRIIEFASGNQKIGIVSSKINYSNFKKLAELLSSKNLIFKEYNFDPVLEFANVQTEEKLGELRYIPVEISGITPEDKFCKLVKKLDELNIDNLIVTKLEEIAYITNLRGNEIPFNSSFKAKALVDKDKCTIYSNLDRITSDVMLKFSNKFEFRPEEEFFSYINSIKNDVRIGFTPDSTNLHLYNHIKSKEIIEIETGPIAFMKSVKNKTELDYMQDCFVKTDIVVSRAVSWLNQNLEKGVEISEKCFSDKVKKLFLEEGAYGLSFETISSSGKNTSIIHYSHPDPDKYIQAGELVLLDCGGYWEGGYATDITRTFLACGAAAKADERQRQIYTKVLRAFLHGLNFEIKEESTGFDIDQKVRRIAMEDISASFKFPHGTGHGVGIPVHECPPRISPAEQAKIVLKSGMCFTIEPGLYDDNWGGVRLENTVAIVDGKIKTLTRSKFDENLINYDNLSEQERIWLTDYQRKAL